MVIFADNITQDHTYSITRKDFSDRTTTNIAKEVVCKHYMSRNMIEKNDSLDIWGFDLPLTPPSSPCSIMDLDEDTDFCYRLQPVCTASEESIDEIVLPTYRKTESIVIKDCMWGAGSAKKPEYSFTRSLGELPSAKHLSVDTADVCNKLLGVDPSEVFPPLDERLVLRDYISSDSDDDTDVDVVTVEPKLLSSKVEDSFPRSPDIITPPKTPDSLPDTSNTCYASNTYGQSSSMECDDNSALGQSSNTAAIQKSSKSSKEMAELQENFSRASHNVLERKRRNELKSKFYSLRDSVPELSGNKKIPKVVILKKAIDYIATIRTEEGMLKSEMQRQKKLHQELRKRLLTVLRSKSSS